MSYAQNYKKNKTKHALGYGFWLGYIFEHLRVPVKNRHHQTTKHVIGVVNKIDILAPQRGVNAPLQRLKAISAKRILKFQLFVP